MLKAIKPEDTPRAEADFSPSLTNPAVALCSEMWERAHRVALEKSRNLYAAERCANIAFRLALPALSGHQNICDFIACVGYGILLGAIKEKNAGKLRYAAQVALGAIPQQSKTQSRTAAPTVV